MNSLIQDDTAIVIEKLFSFVAFALSWGRNIWHVESELQKHLIKRQHSAISFSPVRSLCIALCFVTQAFGDCIRMFLECNPVANKFVGFTVAAKEGYYFLTLFFQSQSSVQFSSAHAVFCACDLLQLTLSQDALTLKEFKRCYGYAPAVSTKFPFPCPRSWLASSESCPKWKLHSQGSSWCFSDTVRVTF